VENVAEVLCEKREAIGEIIKAIAGEGKSS